MRMPTRLKTRLDSLIKTRLSSVVGRHFRRNEGTTDYATIPAVTLAGDFVIEFEVLLSSAHDNAGFISFFNSIDTELLQIGVSDGLWKIGTNGRTPGFGSFVEFGKFHAVQLSLQQSDLVLKINGVENYRVTPSGGVNWLRESFNKCEIYRNSHNSYSRIIGIVANLKIWDSGTLIRHYPLDDNSNTIHDLASSQNGTIINGNNEDWGLFTKQVSGDWKGNGLDVPPWDSVDQVLVKS